MASPSTTLATGTVAATRVFTPAPTCFTAPLALTKTSTATTKGGTIYSTITVGCPNNVYLSQVISQKSALPTDCCGPFAPVSPDASSTYYAYTLPIMARGQICPSGYVPRSLATVNLETTAVCCPSNLLDGYGSTLCSSTYDGTALASGTEYITVTNTVAFALLAVWNQRVLSELSTTVATNTAQIFASVSATRYLPTTARTSLSFVTGTSLPTVATVTRNIGILVGAIVGAIAVLVILCIVACCVWTKCRKSRREKNAYNKNGLNANAAVGNMPGGIINNETKTPAVSHSPFTPSPVYQQPPLANSGAQELYGNGMARPNHEVDGQSSVHQLHGQSSNPGLYGQQPQFEMPGNPVQPGQFGNSPVSLNSPQGQQQYGNSQSHQQQWPIMELPASEGRWPGPAK